MEITTGAVCGRTWAIHLPRAVVGCYRLEGQDVILLDSGNLTGGELERWVEAQGFHVRAVLNSHEHWDHVAANGYFQRVHGAKIYMPKLEAALMATALARKAGHQPGLLAEIEDFYSQLQPYTVDEEIGLEDSTVEVCGVPFRVLHTPGHSVDHVSYITPDNVLYAGDVLMSHDALRQAKITYAICHTIDLASKEKLRGLHCAAYILAHGSVEQSIDGLIDENCAFVRGRAEDVYHLLERPMPMEEIVRRCWQRFGLRAGHYYKNMEMANMIRVLVEYLADTGRLRYRYQEGVAYYMRANQREESQWK